MTSIPSQNTGIATPESANNMATTSNSEYGRIADMTPVSRPTLTATNIAATVSSSVAGNRSPINRATGWC